MEKGFDSALCIFQQNMSDSHYKRFMEIQKGAIMGFCGVTSWKDVPGIWKEIETTKSDEDLCSVLQRHWDKNKMNLDVLLYSIYWGEELM